MLISHLCDYRDIYIVKGRITTEDRDINHRPNKKLNFKNNASFRSCVAKINNVLTEKTEALDIVMLMTFTMAVKITPLLQEVSGIIIEMK